MTTTAKRQRQREGRVARMEVERKQAIRAARRRRIITAVVVAALVVAVMALIAFFGNKDDEQTSDQAAASTTTTAPPADEPEVTIPETPPPTELQSTDITAGDGEEAQTGDTLSVRYVGKIYETGETFDSTYDSPDPVDVQLVSPGVIEGWAQGLVGMKAGGRRQLVIPPALGYGPQGDPPTIPANSTLVFVIDLIAVQKPAAPGG